MGIFDELRSDFEQRNQIYETIDTLRDDLKDVTEKYNETINNCQCEADKINESIKRKEMLISNLATFDSNSISMVITDILNSLTDKRYVCLHKPVKIFYKYDKSVNVIVEEDNSDFNIEGFYMSYSELCASIPNVILMGYKDEKISFKPYNPYDEKFRTFESRKTGM